MQKSSVHPRALKLTPILLVLVHIILVTSKAMREAWSHPCRSHTLPRPHGINMGLLQGSNHNPYTRVS